MSEASQTQQLGSGQLARVSQSWLSCIPAPGTVLAGSGPLSPVQRRAAAMGDANSAVRKTCQPCPCPLSTQPLSIQADLLLPSTVAVLTRLPQGELVQIPRLGYEKEAQSLLHRVTSRCFFNKL